MGKRRNYSKRSLGSLPKGLPNKGNDANPFEVTARQKRPKHQVHNRILGGKARPSALAQAVSQRRKAIQEQLKSSRKTNVFDDKRIGEYTMSREDQALQRIVKERVRQSKRSNKYNLNDDNEVVLTHGGKAIDSLTAKDHVILSDDEDGVGDLDQVDTSMHFGGTGLVEASPYGSGQQSMQSMYSSRKTELDDFIAQRKVLKAERQQAKENQVETFETMDEKFEELAAMLQFRDKEKEIREKVVAKREGMLSAEDQEFEDWDQQTRQYQFLERKVKATDRTKTPEEIAKEEADRLHKLETRRLARMNGDFEDDDFSDLSHTEEETYHKRRKKAQDSRNPEALDDSDDEVSVDDLRTRFTADGLVQIDKNGAVVKKIGGEESSEIPLSAGTRVSVKYHAQEQIDDEDAAWYDGAIARVHLNTSTITYDVEYDDGDFEENVLRENMNLITLSSKEVKKEHERLQSDADLRAKRQKAKEKARADMPYVFEAPTTLEALHDLIGRYASTGQEASLIVQRIHSSNSVRLDKRNMSKMQNFYDVVLRRFIAIGDAIYANGDGGPELARFAQLDALNRTLFAMAQDSPDLASSVWTRRLGILQNAQSKRLRDSELEQEDSFSAWPSTGVMLVLRSLGHVFPVTDKRHHVVTPAILFLGEMLASTPISSIHDLVMATFAAGLLVEYTREAKRVVPEALSFLSSALHLFSTSPKDSANSFCLPSCASAAESLNTLRQKTCQYKSDNVPRLGLDQKSMGCRKTPVSVLHSLLHVTEVLVSQLEGSVVASEREFFHDLGRSLLLLDPKNSDMPLPSVIQTKLRTVAAKFVELDIGRPRLPVQRRAAPSTVEQAIKSLAPRMENPERYSMSRDKGKNSDQAAADRTRRELKREHKAMTRELRLDSAFVERERRQEKEKRDSADKAQRHKAFAWLESEQGTMNQQVAQGGGLLSGGGMGAAKAKAATAKLGIKKGGKFK